MAEISWITIDKKSGSGNQKINVTAAAHTGRLARSGTIVVKTAGTAGSAVTKNVAVTQNLRPVFVTKGADASVTAADITKDITFTTNSQSFKVACTGGTVGAVKVKGAAVTASSGNYTPSGDPGATAQYTVTVTVTFPANTTVQAKRITTSLTDATTSSATASVVITQAAANSNLTVDPETLTFAYGGESKTFSITSNDSWTITSNA